MLSVSGWAIFAEVSHDPVLQLSVRELLFHKRDRMYCMCTRALRGSQRVNFVRRLLARYDRVVMWMVLLSEVWQDLLKATQAAARVSRAAPVRIQLRRPLSASPAKLGDSLPQLRLQPACSAFPVCFVSI